MRKKVIASYLKNFNCVGGICEDNCCIGWNVEIDKKTTGKYKKVKDKELAGLMEKYIYKNDDCYDEHVDYSLVELRDNKNCPFLNQEKLCTIQAKLGETYLSNVCSSYPRMINELDSVLEYSATTSCPEIAKLALGAKGGIEFEKIESIDRIECDQVEANDYRNDIISITVNTKIKSNPFLVKHLQELRGLTIEILQLREYQLWQRILILGIFFQKVQEIQNKNKGEEIPELILQFSDRLDHQGFETGFAKELETYPINRDVQLKILKEISDQFNDSNEIDSEKYMSFIDEFNQGIAEKPISLLYEEIYKPFMKNNEYILENYLVNYVFQSFFPAAESNQPFEAYQHLVIRYSLIKLYLMGIGGFRRELTDTLAIEFIQSFSKGLEHNYKYFEQVSKYMQKSNFNTLSTMAILIRN